MRFLFIGLLFFGILPLIAQHSFSEVDQLIEQGTELDNNQLKHGEALIKYQAALDILTTEYPDSIWYLALVSCKIGYAHVNTGNYRLAGNFLEKGLNLYRQVNDTRSDSFVQALHDLGVIYERIGNTTAALKYYQLAVDSAKVTFGKQNIELVKYYNSAGYGQNTYGNTKEAIPLLGNAYQILLAQDSLSYNWMWFTATNLGNSYHILAIEGDSMYADSALVYYRKSLAFCKKAFDANGIELAQAYYTIAGILNNMVRTDESILYLDSAVQINPNVLRVPDEKGEFYYRGAQFEYEAKDYSAAERHFLLAAEYFVEDPMKLKGDAWLRVAGIMMLEGRFKEATNYLEKVCEVYRKDFGENHYKTTTVCEQLKYTDTWSTSYIRDLFQGMSEEEIIGQLRNILYTDEEVPTELELVAAQMRSVGTQETMAFRSFDAYLAFRKGNFEKALQIIQDAFIEFFPDFDDNDFASNPPLNGLYPEPGNIYSFFNLKALIYQKIWLEYQDADALLKSYHLYIKADTLLNDLRLNSVDEDRANIGEMIQALYTGMSMVAANLYQQTGEMEYFEKVFYASERVKSYTLLVESVDQYRMESLAPRDLLSEEKRLKEKLLTLRKDVVYGAAEEGNLFTTKSALALLQEQLKTDYPQYWEAKYSQPIVQLKDFAETIDDQKMVINYSLSDGDFLTIVVLGSNGYTAIFNKQIEGLQDSIATLITIIKSANPEPADYLSLLTFLSRELVPFTIPTGIEQLIVIPDGLLHRLPFELLLREPVTNHSLTFTQLPILLKRYSISYGISASHMYKQQQAQKALNSYSDFLIAYNTAKLKSVEEVKELWQNAGESVQVLESSQSSKSDLLARDFSSCQVLQINAHGAEWDDLAKAGMILYNGEMVYYHEFYSLNLPVDLVLLIGCGTAKGDIIEGEGVLGLNRALISSGASNIVLSQYETQTETADIFTSTFYKQLMTQKTSYADAIRAAQLAILENPDYSSPFYWAGFQLIGY